MTLITLALGLLLSTFSPDGTSNGEQPQQNEQQMMEGQEGCDYIIIDPTEM